MLELILIAWFEQLYNVVTTFRSYYRTEYSYTNAKTCSLYKMEGPRRCSRRSGDCIKFFVELIDLNLPVDTVEVL